MKRYQNEVFRTSAAVAVISVNILFPALTVV